ncbi:sigma-70 family RNA polymerase sigma factor [Lachnospiraceae bacterium 3-1]|nr:sigma-70 family RNA polymerase sigma factor [Lachnospiraceae bacterium 3-1]
MNDREMIREIQKGKKEYLNDIAEKYYDDIYRFCCYQTGNCQDAGDLTQETFLKFIRSVEHYRYRNLKGYLLTIARNVCVDYFRSCKRRKENEEDFQEEVEYKREENVQGARTKQEEFLITMSQLTDNLPEMQREAMVLYYGYGMKYREIAQITGTGIATVKSRIRQGTEKIKKSVTRDDCANFM